MVNKLSIQPVPFHPTVQSPKKVQAQTLAGNSFSDHLKVATQELKLSKHASERMQERNIEISDAQWEIISSKVSEAQAKGIKQSLVVLDDAALIVSAKNSTVITALDRDEMKSQIFTNIDGTIVL